MNDNRNSNKTHKKTRVNNLEVSTVFLGIEHGANVLGYPYLWETMIFSLVDGSDIGICERYVSYEEAMLGHDKLCDIVVNNDLK